jgi:D-lactate dehydrogenase
MGKSPMITAVFDTKPYDREYLLGADGSSQMDWRFFEFPLNAITASSVSGAEAVCVFVNDQVDAACIEQLVKQNVKLIALRCAGYNNCDLTTAHAAGLSVVRVPAYSPHAVAEHAVGLLLTLNRKIHRAYNRVRELNFALHGLVGFDLFGKTIGVVGTGKIGKVAAQIFRGFGANVLVSDPFPDEEWSQKQHVQYVSLDELLLTSDIVSLHLPLTPESQHMLNEHSLSRMKRGAFIVNTSRGKLIDTSALIAALKSGQIGGVALDVYEEEEGIFFHDLSGQVLQDDELSHLLMFPNVLITAHQAFLTQEALREIARVTTENILAFRDQRPFVAGTQL